MSTTDNTKLILELFNFKKTLTIEQEEIERVVNTHLNLFNGGASGTPGQLSIINSLVEKLDKFTYDADVKALVENVQDTIKQDELFYDLEDLYRQLENNNQGELYRHPMQVVLNILNEKNERNRTVKILNELRDYTWIPQVKNFMFRFNTNPADRANISSQGGKSNAVYSIVEKVKNEKENGFLTFVGDKWFILTENDVKPTTPSNHSNDVEKLTKLNLLEKALRLGSIENDQIVFEIEEGLEIGISFKNGDIFLNGEKTDKETTLESIFQSPIMPFIRRDMYPVILETSRSLDKFVELDVVQHVSNLTQPHLECYAFNYKDKMYVYSMDRRYGHQFHEYDSATMLVKEMNQQLGFDLSKFYGNKFSNEIQAKRNLEDKEKLVMAKISELNENIVKLEESGLLEINEQIKVAHVSLEGEREFREKQLRKIKRLLSENKQAK